jgi:hypothetical protein
MRDKGQAHLTDDSDMDGKAKQFKRAGRQAGQDRTGQVQLQRGKARQNHFVVATPHPRVLGQQ